MHGRKDRDVEFTIVRNPLRHDNSRFQYEFATWYISSISRNVPLRNLVPPTLGKNWCCKEINSVLNLLFRPPSSAGIRPLWVKTEQVFSTVPSHNATEAQRQNVVRAIRPRWIAKSSKESVPKGTKPTA